MQNDELKEKLIYINRITKVVKGGRRCAFSALVVAGNQSGKLGVAHAKAKQVTDAIKKATDLAKRRLIHIPLKEGRTLHHDVIAKKGSGKVILRTAPKGTGIIAGGPVRAILEQVGITNILSKNTGSTNAINVVKAVEYGLKELSPFEVIEKRKISCYDLCFFNQ